MKVTVRKNRRKNWSILSKATTLWLVGFILIMYTSFVLVLTAITFCVFACHRQPKIAATNMNSF